ncbi:MAG: ankyrin repeat domain-containing protein [Wolbachia endosymbiont of Menacanthus eurysternus]|nr:ankyrin repeat domain-containing protein [Wolbachia endosymbiont of Menacanthus eurysternus]
MHINQSEERRLSYLQTRSASVDSGFGDEEVINKTEVTNKANNSVHAALKAVKKGRRKFEKWQKKSSVDIRNIRDEEGSNILHLIARLKKKQKCRSLNFLIERISEEDLAKLINSKNWDGKTPLQVALIDKIKKGKHGSHTIQDNDNTLKFLVTLLEHGAKPDQLSLSAEDLGKLSKKQNEYYREFLEKLAERKPEIRTQVEEIIERTINTPDNSGNYLLHSAIKNNKKNFFKELLQKGADVSLKDANGDNALHLIAKLEKEQKLEFLNAVLNISKWEGKEPLKAQLREAIKAANQEGKTPMQMALTAKVIKNRHNLIAWEDNTIKFCIKLLEGGAHPNQLKLAESSLFQERKAHYHSFLLKLSKSVQKSELDQETKNLVTIQVGKIINDGYPLHQAVLDRNIDNFNELLRSGYDITTKNAEENTVLHYAVKLDEGAKYEFTELILEKNKELVNTPNRKQQTPIHQLLQHIKEKSENRLCTDRKFEKTNRYKTLELLLRNGADITAQDKEGNNALHYIASLKGEQKVTCLKLISSLMEGKKISEDQLSKAINAINGEGRTPLQVALIKKAEKGKHLSQMKTIFDPTFREDNTTKFCAKLLQNGANPDSLDLKDEKFHTDSYYLVLRDLRDYRKTPHTVQEKARETKKQLEKKYNIKTFSGQLQSTAQSVGSSIKEAASNTGKALSAIAKYIDPASRTRELLAITITVTVIAMAAFAFFQGQVGIGAAIPIIAVAGAVCLTLTLGFSGIKKLFEDSTDKVKNLIDNDQQKTSDQPEYTNPPNSQMSDTRSEPHKKLHERIA